MYEHSWEIGSKYRRIASRVCASVIFTQQGVVGEQRESTRVGRLLRGDGSGSRPHFSKATCHHIISRQQHRQQHRAEWG